MKRHMTGCRIAAIGIGIWLGAGMTIGVAQSSPDAAGQRARGEDAGGFVAVSGCLQEFSSPAGAAGPGAASPSSSPASSTQSALAPASEQFVLANVRPLPSTSGRSTTKTEPSVPGGAGASGTAGSGETPQSATGGATTPPTATGTVAANIATRYLVVGLQVDELRKHVRHQVEVSGTVEPRRESATTTATSRGPLDDLRRLHVSSIRMIADACTPSGSPDE
jgi:hypothetical protein